VQHGHAEQKGGQPLRQQRPLARLRRRRLRDEVGHVALLAQEAVDGRRAVGEPRGHEHEQRDGRLELVLGGRARAFTFRLHQDVHALLDQ